MRKCHPSQSVARRGLPAPESHWRDWQRQISPHFPVPRIHLLLWPFLDSSDCAELRACCHRFEQGSPEIFHSTMHLLCMLESGSMEEQIRACKCLVNCDRHPGKSRGKFQAAIRKMKSQMRKRRVILDNEENRLVEEATWKVCYWGHGMIGRLLLSPTLRPQRALS